MHIITDDQVHELITMSDAISTLRLALAEQGTQQAKIQPRVRTLGESISLSTMGAILPGAGVCGAKVYSTHKGIFDAYSGERDHAFRRIVIMDSE